MGKLFRRIINKTERFKNNIEDRQYRYIKREQEYRKTIEDLENQIKQQSLNPFKIEGKGRESDEDEEHNFETYIPSQTSQSIVNSHRMLLKYINDIQIDTAKALVSYPLKLIFTYR